MNKVVESSLGSYGKTLYQLSGKYKIAIGKRSEGYKLYLRDYTGYQVSYDPSVNFFTQVSKFLTTSTRVNTNNIGYGIYRDKDLKSAHIPLYLGYKKSKYPDTFTVLKMPRKDYTLNDNIFQDTTVIDIVDINKLGLSYIFDNIFDLLLDDDRLLDFPISLYWSNNNKDHQIILHGFDYINNCVTSVPINISDYVYNNTKDDDSIKFIDNKILELYESHNLIFPRFINLEFDFDYTNYDINLPQFDNIFGFLSNTNTVTNPDLTSNDYKTLICNDSDPYVIKFREPAANDTLIDINVQYDNTGFIQDIVNQQYSCNIKGISNLKASTHIIINNSVDNILYDYTVITSDIKDTLYETIIYVFNKITIISNGYINYSTKYISEDNITVKIKTFDKLVINIVYNSVLVYTGTTTNITYKDVQLISGVFSIGDSIIINDQNYVINDLFEYDERNIIRLNENPNITAITSVGVIKKYHEYYKTITPIAFKTFLNTLNICSDYIYNSIYDIFIQEGYNLPSTIIRQYNDPITVDKKMLTDSTKPDVIFGQSYNSRISYHTMNYDNLFGVRNTCSDKEYKFNYFNILLDDNNDPSISRNYASALYDDNDKVKRFCSKYKKPDWYRSNIYRVSDQYCQTIFLGVSYLLPYRYYGYSFSVVYDYLTSTESELGKYFFRVNDINKTLDLYINRRYFFDFIIKNNSSFFDPSLFYLQNDSLANWLNVNRINTYDEAIFSGYFDYNTRSLKLSNGISIDTDINDFELITVDSGKNIIFRGSDSTFGFNEIFINGDNKIDFKIPITVYDTNNVLEDSSYSTKDILYTLFEIKLLNTTVIQENYVICDDIEIVMFPNTFIMNRIGAEFEYPFELLDVKLTDNPQSSYRERYIHTFNQFHIIIDEQEDDNITYHIQGFQNNIDSSNFISTNSENSYSEYAIQSKISLNDSWYRLIYKKNMFDDNDPIASVDKFVVSNNQSLVSDILNAEISSNPYYNNGSYTQYFLDMIRSINVGDTIEYDMFDNNPVWNMARNILRNMISYDMVSSVLVNDYYTSMNIDSYKNNISGKVLNVLNDSDQIVESCLIKIINQDVNKSSDKKELYRYSTFYSTILEDCLLIDIDKTLLSDNNKYIKTIYSENFGGENINATGIWGEIKGQSISSIYTGTNFSIQTLYYKNSLINIKNLLKSYLPISQAIINNNNIDYISKFSNDTDEYIKDQYALYCLKNIYDIESIYINNIMTSFDYNNIDYTIKILDNIDVDELTTIINLSLR